MGKGNLEKKYQIYTAVVHWNNGPSINLILVQHVVIHFFMIILEEENINFTWQWSPPIIGQYIFQSYGGPLIPSLKFNYFNQLYVSMQM